MTRTSAIAEVLGPPGEAVRRRFEVPILAAALLVIPVILVEERATSPAVLDLARWTNWLIWAAFAAELVTLTALADRKSAYLRRAWLDVFIVLVSFPPLPELFAAVRLLRLTRLARVLRILRLARLAAILNRAGQAAGAIFRSHGLGYMALLTILLTLGVGAAFALLEGTAIGDGLWWAIVTVTTVGYGDVLPETPAGRISGAILMLLGIGFVALVTAAIAARFVGDEEQDLAAEIRRIHERLDGIEASLRNEAPGAEEGLGESITRPSRTSG
jgi:voltage-gated potassium channel